ncbi:hypothetical protein, conserved [Trypanosoma brucei gambiense DAL972]|uniref:Uncharacterized protein n=1 Tax=Trypanosoma brucei gambiense (strain MHOM/CI/86/DAL972) TaxID=679716 RepID=C9ZKV6_TRYB9|nr:hypothetical protein, conserved [Trypanosoma brucei gambiense DAL972]CBH09699.1 hypothetical protein, conserved [Trypanosoma brucei gambiense DAL972]|eukprot:XP_011771992.1 hypothetical protein, conserved [Trypanosoma brucei gambiense DAL972]
MSVLSEWRREWTTEAHAHRQRLTKNALQRNLREDVQRRVTSSSVSSSIAVVDCCWSRGQCPCDATPSVTTALAPYLFCALEDGVVCVINTSNFAKTYLFEDDSLHRREKERADRKETTPQHDTQRDRLVAIDCFPLQQKPKREVTATKQVAGQPTVADSEVISLLCTVVDGFVCTFTIDAVTISRARSHSLKASNVCRAIKLPADTDLSDRGSWKTFSIRFSQQGSRIIVLATSTGPPTRNPTAFSNTAGSRAGLIYTTFLCVLKRQENDANGVYAVEKQWTKVLPPNGDTTTELLCVTWWDDEESVILVVWSDGTVCLMDVALSTIAQSVIFSSAEDLRPGRVVTAVASPPSFQGAPASRTSTSTPSAVSATVTSGTSNCSRPTGLLAVVVDENIIVQFAVHSSLHKNEPTSSEEPPLKTQKVESPSQGEMDSPTLTLEPGPQTHCSEDIPIGDIAIFDCLLPHTLCVLLESGALLILDGTTVEVLYQRQLSRLFPSKVTRRATSGADGGSNDKRSGNSRECSFLLRPKDRPLTMCILEHNTAVILRAS